MSIINSLTDGSCKSKFDIFFNPSLLNRLYIESYILGELANHQLNLPKNSKKEEFKKLPLDSIFLGLFSEIDELKTELVDLSNIDYKKVYSELGDVAAYLVGLIEWLLEHQKLRE